MTNKIRTLMALFVLIIIPNAAVAATQIFTPSDLDIWDLDHGHYYTWGIEYDVPQNEIIVGASLFFDDIRNYNSSDNDLWVQLLDNSPIGLTQYYDGYSAQVNAFDGQGTLLNQWHNLPSTPQDITYDFDIGEIAILNSYIADGTLGLGFDPDCHFYNDGVSLKIETAPVPVPSSITLLSLGLIAILGIGRRK